MRGLYVTSSHRVILTTSIKDGGVQRHASLKKNAQVGAARVIKVAPDDILG